jgi:ribosome biogenesis protein BRX1
MWLASAPNGCTIKFRVENIHTMSELGFGGNCLKGGRGLVVFDSSFENSDQVHKSLIRELLRGMFCVPAKGVRGMKPFVDHITGVYWLDGKIWLRFYEIRETDEKKEGKEKMELSLIEIGPRFVLTPVLILEGSFGGAVMYKNEQYVSGNQVRSEKRRKADVYSRRRNEAEQRGLKKTLLAAGQEERRDDNLAVVFR